MAAAATALRSGPPPLPSAVHEEDADDAATNDDDAEDTPLNRCLVVGCKCNKLLEAAKGTVSGSAILMQTLSFSSKPPFAPFPSRTISHYQSTAWNNALYPVHLHVITRYTVPHLIPPSSAHALALTSIIPADSFEFMA